MVRSNARQATVVAVVLVLAALAGRQGGSAAEVKTQLAAENLRCSSCLAEIERYLARFPEVASVKGDVSRGRLLVLHDDRLSPAVIRALVTELGYPARFVEEPLENGGSDSEPSCGSCPLSGTDPGATPCPAGSSSWKALWKRIWPKSN